MNRPLQIVNLLGVLALAVLCAFQWQTNRKLNLEGISLEKTRRELAAKVEEQARTITNLGVDLDGFREQLTKASHNWKESDARAGSLDRENHRLTAERDQLKADLANWTQAVGARDKKLEEANQTIQRIAADRNEIVAKFNTLAEKHNKVVHDLNETLAQLASARANAADGKADASGATRIR